MKCWLRLFILGFRVGEVSCPARYFKEASSINFLRSVKYGFGVFVDRNSLQSPTMASENISNFQHLGPQASPVSQWAPLVLKKFNTFLQVQQENN